MKEFLFSRSHKKHYSSAVVRMGKNNMGFSLMELIIVIAIMAILAAVAIPVFGMFVEKTEKAKDSTLVADIIKAIEIGAKSSAFVSDNSFTKGATTYPVAIIVLSDNGCEVMASSSSIVTSSSTCKLKTINNYVTSGNYRIKETIDAQSVATVGTHIYHDIYEVTATTSITFCETHSNLNEREVDLSWSKDNCGFYSFTTGSYVFEDDCKGVYALATDHVEGGTITKEELEAIADDNRVISTNRTPIYQALTAAFGDDLSSLKLSYDGWGNAEQEAHTYASLLTYTDTLIGDIKETADALIFAVNVAALAGIDVSEYLTEDYSDASDMMDAYSRYIQTEFTSVDWMIQWNAAAGGSTTHAFGMGSTLDYCYASRMAYNTAFASYCSTNGVNSTYVEVLKDYHHTNSYGIQIPDVTNTAAFSNKDSSNENSLYSQFIKAGDSTGAAFDQCAKLFEIYKDSEACKANGEVFYDTMCTVAQTGSEAYQSGEGGTDAYFDYYENLMKEMSAYYDFISTYEGSGIIILVTVDNGEVICSVSPATANPRDKK